MVEAMCSEDAAGAEVTIAATAASTSDLPAGRTTKQLGKWKEVCPVLAVGGRLAHLPEPRPDLLETDLQTIIKLLSTNILIQYNNMQK